MTHLKIGDVIIDSRHNRMSIKIVTEISERFISTTSGKFSIKLLDSEFISIGKR